MGTQIDGNSSNISDSGIFLKAFSLIILIDYFETNAGWCLLRTLWKLWWIQLLAEWEAQCKLWYIFTLLLFLKNGLFNYWCYNVIMKRCPFILPLGTLPLSCEVTVIWLFLAGLHVFSCFLWIFSFPQEGAHWAWWRRVKQHQWFYVEIWTTGHQNNTSAKEYKMTNSE